MFIINDPHWKSRCYKNHEFVAKAAALPHAATSIRAMNPPARGRTYWMKTMHEWHWISAAIALAGILLFAVTGITLNHASQFESGPQRHSSVKQAVPARLVNSLSVTVAQLGAGSAGATPELRQWLSEAFQIDVRGRTADWNAREIYFSLPRPGGDAWLRIDLKNSLATYEVTQSGWIAYLNDLHKGRNTGAIWNGFIDVMALACIVFSVTGLIILKLHARHRRLTWPLVGVGLMIPVVVAVLLIH